VPLIELPYSLGAYQVVWYDVHMTNYHRTEAQKQHLREIFTKPPLFERCITQPNGCLLWTGGFNAKGYGMTNVFRDGRWRATSTHRRAWELVNGPIPKGMCVCHKCDTPACCNVDHLFLGTNRDNMADMRAKCRQTKGSQKAISKLTEAQVLAIRADTRTHRTIAKDYGVSSPTITCIKTRKAWGWLQ
jgi:hypothetical protein